MTQDNGFIAVRTGRHQVDRHAADFGNALQVATGRLGQLVVLGDADGRFRPTRQLFQDRLRLRNRVRAIRQHVAEFAVHAVADAELNRFQTVQHVQLGDAQAGNAVQTDRTLQRRAIKPAAATRTTCDRTEFLADGGQAGADLVNQFRGERTRTDAGGVRLGDTQYVIQLLRAYTSTSGRGTSHAIAAGDEGVRAVIDVQQGALRTFEKNALAFLLHCVQVARHVLDHRRNSRSQCHGLIAHLAGRHRFGAQVLGQHEVVVIQHFGELLVKQRRVKQVLHAQCATGDLVFVRRADAATGRADLALALARFARLVDGHVIRQDQRADFGNLQARTHVQTGGLKLFDFLEQGFRGQHDAIADEAGDTGMHDARRDQAKNRLLAVDPQRMAGVVTALKANHALDGFRQPIDDLAFALVTPLGADYDYVLAHVTNQYRVSREIRKSPRGPLVSKRELVTAF
ncbi:hypothetical protein D3C72_860480 [compost metagenome]